MSNDIQKLVRDRLEHVELILRLQPHYCSTALLQRVGPNNWTHPWRYFDALMYYLLLTCFDLIGQNPEWVPYPTWLQSNSKEGERDRAASVLDDARSSVDAARHFYKSYQAIYGVRSSFNRFIDEMLTEKERKSLYFSIKISRAQMSEDPNIMGKTLGEIDEDKKKREFLFDLRNKFTHRAVTMGSPIGGIYPAMYEHVVIDGQKMKGYTEIYREKKNEEWLVYGVRDWPFVLVELVKSALVRL